MDTVLNLRKIIKLIRLDKRIQYMYQDLPKILNRFLYLIEAVCNLVYLRCLN